MDYDEFFARWREELQRSGLRNFGFGELSIDLHSLDRRCVARVEPIGGQQAEPFNVFGELRWSWSALQTARTYTCEQDLISEVLGLGTSEIVTEPAWLRVDVVLRAALPYERPSPLPSPDAWTRWVTELTHRLENIERLSPEEPVRERGDGAIEVHGWQGAPKATVTCKPDGTLVLDGVRLEAWQRIELPRRLDDQRLGGDPEPALQLLFFRVKRALYAWSETLDHLIGRSHPRS